MFKGIAEFAADAPEVISGDNYEAKAGTLFDRLSRCKVNIFNIAKINSEVRGGKSPRIKRLSEYIGEKYLFGGFKRCLYAVQKFQSDTERKLCVLLEREAVKWFKPAKGQFQIYYKSGADHLEYQPDFVAETARVIYMLEPKSRTEMTSAEVVAKQEAAVNWCRQATDHARTCSGKPWKYLLIPHDAIAENVTIEGLADQFSN